MFNVSKFSSARALKFSVFGSVVAGAFQITFRAKIHANDVFLFFKNYFWHQHIKTIQNVQTILNFNKKKKIKFFRNAAAAAFPNMLLATTQEPHPNNMNCRLDITCKTHITSKRTPIPSWPVHAVLPKSVQGWDVLQSD